MKKNNSIYISREYKREEYIRLKLKINSSSDDWNRAISIMQDRIKGRYLEPMKNLIDKDPDAYGFAAMALCCLLIETLMQFRKGIQKTPFKRNKQYYVAFLTEQLGDVFNRKNEAEIFYTDIRCGILHSAETKNDTCLTDDTSYTVRKIFHGGLMVNVNGLGREISGYFDRYCGELIKSENEDLRRNFIGKMNDITDRWQGTEIADDIWSAICARKNEVIALPDGESYRFEMYGEHKLRIYNFASQGLHIEEASVSITKAEIEKALCYWPNEASIKVLDKGVYMYAILDKCRGDVDRIIAREDDLEE